MIEFAQLLHDRRQVQALKVGNEIVYPPGHHADVPQLLQHVHAEPPVRAVDIHDMGKVTPTGFVENLLPPIVEHIEDDPHHFFIFDRRTTQRAQRALHAHIWRFADFQVQVAAFELHQSLEQLIDFQFLALPQKALGAAYQFQTFAESNAAFTEDEQNAIKALFFESTRILLHSTSPEFPNGLGNSSGQLGKNVMDHCMGGGADGTIPGYEDRVDSGNRPNGIYMPRFRNVKDSSGTALPPKTVSLRNVGNSPLVISAARITGLDAALFATGLFVHALREERKRIAAGVAVAALAALTIMAPFFLRMWQTPAEFTFRARETMVFSRAISSTVRASR